MRHPTAVRFWLAVLLTGVGTGLGAAALTRLLEAVQHRAWNGSATNLLGAAEQAGAWRHVLVLLGAGLVTFVGQLILRRLSSGNGIDTTAAIWFRAEVVGTEKWTEVDDSNDLRAAELCSIQPASPSFSTKQGRLLIARLHRFLLPSQYVLSDCRDSGRAQEQPAAALAELRIASGSAESEAGILSALRSAAAGGRC